MLLIQQFNSKNTMTWKNKLYYNYILFPIFSFFNKIFLTNKKNKSIGQFTFFVQ